MNLTITTSSAPAAGASFAAVTVVPPAWGPITYDLLVAELRNCGIDLDEADLRVAYHLTTYEGASVRAVLRWILSSAAHGRTR